MIKIKKRKFVRNIIIGVVSLFVVAFIVNTAPGYKRNKYKNVINLVIGDTNVTEQLSKPIYKDEQGTIFISKEDIKQLLDKTLYYSAEENMIIATSEVTVASMKIGEKIINVNGTNIDTLNEIIIKDNIVYIPIEEMDIVYNIQISYIEEENVLVIDKLNEGMIKAEAEEITTIRYKQRSLSKKVGELNKGDVVYAFYTTSKGWRLIRTQNGTVGYVKANTLTNEYILRQDMNQKNETKEISTSIEDGTILNIEENKIIIQDLLEITEQGILIKNTDTSNTNAQIWANLKLKDVDLSNFDERTKLIKNIATISRKNEINGINIILEDNKDMERFVLELAPRLNELGIKINVVETEKTKNEIYKNIVNYIIKK